MGAPFTHRVVPLTVLTLALVALVSLALAHALPAQAGGVVSNCTETALRTALAGGGSVTFACGPTPPITLTSPVVITAPTSIDGSNGGSPITLSGGGATRLLQVNAGAALTLTDLTVRDGHTIASDGGAITNDGTLLILTSKFYSNTASIFLSAVPRGGAIASTGVLTIIGSEFAYNSAGNGGALFPRESTSLTSISGSSFHDNHATDSTNGWGGAMLVWNGAQVTMDSTSVVSNTAGTGGALYVTSVSGLTLTQVYLAHNQATSADGGGLWTGGTTYVGATTFYGNTANNGYGGGVFNTGRLLLTASTLEANHAIGGAGLRDIGINPTPTTLSGVVLHANSAADSGGGIYNSSAVILYNSTLSANTAGSLGGGVYQNAGSTGLNNSTADGNSAPQGGGVYNGAGILTLSYSSFSRNTVNYYGGAIYNADRLEVDESTLSGNLSVNGHGGGIYNQPGANAGLRNATLSGNSAIFGLGGGIYNQGGGRVTFVNATLANNSASSGGALSMDPGSTIVLTNTILAYSPSGGNCVGSVTASKYDISSDNSCGLTGPGDKNKVDPLLDALGNYGGPTTGVEHSPLLTHMIKANSPAKDGVVGSDAPGTDERGLPRPGPDGSYDIGAVERQPNDFDYPPRLWLPLVVR